MFRLLCEADVSSFRGFEALRVAEAALAGTFGPAGVSWTVVRERAGDVVSLVVQCTPCGRAAVLRVPADSLRPGMSDVLLVMLC